jgi:hypothetical protein
LEDDGEWESCLTEASIICSGLQLRRLFVTIVVHCNPADPTRLWNKFKEHICDDLAFRLHQFHIPDPTPDQIYDYGLYCIEVMLLDQGRSLELCNLPAIQGNWQAIDENPLLAEQLAYDINDLNHIVAENTARFNPEQQAVYNAVVTSVVERKGHCFFVQSAGGCGKTFVCNTIAAAIRAQGKVVLCVASSGIAALLLVGGCTAHSRFKIPINVHEASFCTIKRGTDLYKVIECTELVIWDEVPMQHCHCIEALDRTLCDILGTESPFGGDF